MGPVDPSVENPGKGRTIRKVMAGEGNFRAAGIFFVIKFLV